jgi:hypothetical protein
MSSELDYAEIVKQAEAAVASIKDGELKSIAFSKILDTLLGQQHTPTRDVSKGKTERKKGRKAVPKSPGKKGGPKGYVEELIDEGFFKTPKTLSSIRAELGNRGRHIPVTSLSNPMMVLCQERRLRRQKAKDGKKQVFTYSNW